jgi:alkanesulfonate monooxygenase SsuD/methylene tetrahydromethanopterin reductase-like flavin-dependent oxidoreductase (luciferase family)
MTVGLITHIDNPGVADVTALARAAESAGADWLGLPDAFWWRDTWILAAEATRVTQRLAVGPVVTNPYTRHPFVTLAAVATLQDIAGPRVVLGVGAGGSEVGGAAKISRADAPERTVELAGLIRRVAAGQPLDAESGRGLEVPLAPPRIIVGGRGARMLRAAGQVGDEALLWAVPRSELARTVDLVRQGSAARGPELPDVGITWAPLVERGKASRALLRRAAAYAVLNNRDETRERWDVDDGLVVRVRQLLLAGDTEQAERLIPDAVAEDLSVPRDVGTAAAVAADIGAAGIALAATDVGEVEEQVAWARSVLAASAGRASRWPGQPQPHEPDRPSRPAVTPLDDRCPPTAGL